MKRGLSELKNVVMVPHIGSATAYSREGMASLAACNVAGVLLGYPAWNRLPVSQFLGGDFPDYAHSILNAEKLGYPMLGS
jgi:hydroxypyruvate reductase 1